MNDRTLLRSYALHRDQAAFSELVHRHANLVYSAARRQVGDHHRAQEVTQSVFLALSRKAGALAEHPVLAAWLFQSTRLSSAKLRETELRRMAREDRSALGADEVAESVENAGGEWERIAPVLDEALATLREKDRAAVVLRYFQQRSHAEVGAALGIGENAARMRTERALEKLRAALVRRGVRSTAEALGVALGAQGVMAAPPGVGTAVIAATAAAVAQPGVFSGMVFMGQLKTVGVSLVAAALASLATYHLLQRNVAGFPERRIPPAGTLAAPMESRNDGGTDTLLDANAELLARLANAEAQLEKNAEELAIARRRLADLRRPLTVQNVNLVSSTLRAATKPGEVIVTGGSPTKEGKRTFAFVTPQNLGPTEGGAQIAFVAKLVDLPEALIREMGMDHLTTGAANTLQHGEVWAASEVARLMDRLREFAGVDILATPRVCVLAGMKAEATIGESNKDGEFIGIRIGFLSEAPAADGTLNTEVSVELAGNPAE